MKSVLLIQSRTNPERVAQERANFSRAVGGNASIGFLSALDSSPSWESPEQILKGYSGVIFGGSSDFDFNSGRDENDPFHVVSLVILTRVRNLVSYALHHEVPLLGVSFGHLLIADSLGGKVKSLRQEAQLGSYEVVRTKEGAEDPLFSALPAKFFAQFAHKDGPTALPDTATLLAASDGCKYAALRYGPSAYTVLFHPEVRRMRLEETAFHESPEASQLVALWVERIAGTRTKETPKKSSRAKMRAKRH